MVGMVIAAEQVRLLQANGVDEFHFYTLNEPARFDICHSPRAGRSRSNRTLSDADRDMVPACLVRFQRARLGFSREFGVSPSSSRSSGPRWCW
jgi:hypothetical protein